VGAIDQHLLAEKLEALAGVVQANDELLETFGTFVRTSDEAVVRINPARFARDRGLSTEAVVGLFLHARKIGLLSMEWQYVCPGCG